MSNGSANVIGPGKRLFAEPTYMQDETSFQVDNTSDAYYKSPYYKQHRDDVLPIPTPPPTAPLNLQDVVGQGFLNPVVNAAKITFHAVGDTGASKSLAIATEAGVADAMVADLAQPRRDAPAFFYHLGDVIYNFGEAEYYYDQFYEPYREYDRPIFAIPGNHDGGMKYNSDSPPTPLYPSLDAFLRNFCAPQPAPSPDAGALVRSAMTQPGVYFTLDAPFVSIVGLYSNVLEGPGVISDQKGMYPALDTKQVDWLTGELERLKGPRQNLERAVILACHHPPASADTKHGGGVGHAEDIDNACKAAGLWPDAVLSGHAHLYQRFTRETAGRQIPYVVSGSGGHATTLPRGEVLGKAPLTWGEYTLVKEPILRYGYLTITVDMSTSGTETLEIVFQAPTDPTARDETTLNLRTNQIVVI